MSDADRLANDLAAAPLKAVPLAAAVVKKTAQNVKDHMVNEARSNGTYKHFHRSISYDVHLAFGGIEAEIGPDKDRTQGALGNVLYFGTSKNAPVLDINSGLRAEEEAFAENLADAAERALGL
jgi:hypothetical protein